MADDYCVDSIESVESGIFLGVREVRRVYLITYSQADTTKVPSREKFSDIVLQAFQQREVHNAQCAVEHWSCCLEYHRDGGVHFHMAIKLTRPKRWLAVRQLIHARYGINVHFSNRHVNYYSAWTYVCKQDTELLLSPGHPDLWNSEPPATTAACQAAADRRENELGEVEESELEAESTSRRQGKKRKRSPRLSMFEVSELAVSKGIKNYLQLLALAKRQKTEGKKDLAEFIVNRGKKAVEEALKLGWEIEESEEKLRRQQMSRMEILENALAGDCTENCGGRWLNMALDILRRNQIERTHFSTAVRDLLKNGRGKYRNIFLKGGANRGKTFLLNPLTVIYKAFVNPASTTFAWVGAESAEVIFLNDFRWTSQVLPWQDMLLLLEGQPVHLSAPKTHYAQDIVFDKDTPIFCTSKSEILSIKNGVLDEKETEMMAVRWRVFSLHAQIPEAEQVHDVNPCPRCFAEFILV